MDFYIDKFEYVVDLLRTTGNYTATLVSGTVYEITSDVITRLSVKEFVQLNAIYGRVTEIVSSKIFRVDIKAQTIVASGTWKALAPYSDFGTSKTINTKLLQKNSYDFQYQKFPLIALMMPAPVSTSNGVSSIDANILFVTFTDKRYKPEERMENIFKPILYPLVDKFLGMLKRSGEFIDYSPDYTQIDRMFYGKESGEVQNIANVFDDPLDAVQLRGLKLTYIKENCTPTYVPQTVEGYGFPYIFERYFEN